MRVDDERKATTNIKIVRGWKLERPGSFLKMNVKMKGLSVWEINTLIQFSI